MTPPIPARLVRRLGPLGLLLVLLADHPAGLGSAGRATAAGRVGGSRRSVQPAPTPGPGESASTGAAGAAHPHVHSAAADPSQGMHISSVTGDPIPSIMLTWGAETTHVGVPVPLAFEVTGHDGGVDTSRNGMALLLLDDPIARVTPGAGAQSSGSGAAPAALTGHPEGPGQRVALPLTAGTATVSVAYTTPGPHHVLGQLADDIEIAGESHFVQVADMFLALEGPSTVAQGATAQVAVVARDAAGAPVTGYTGIIVLTTTDPGAQVADVTTTGPPSTSTVAGATAFPTRGAAHPLQPGDGGRATFAVTFATAGTQTLTASDADAPARHTALPVAVTAAASPPLAPTATATPSPTPTPPGTTTATATPAPQPTTTATATATATATPTPTSTVSATPATSPSPTVTPTPTATATAAATPRVLSAAAGRGEAGLPLLLTRSPRLAGTPSFAVTTSAPSTNAGVPLTMTVQALTADGTVNTAYAGTVKFTSTDAAFAPGAGYRYTFTTADTGQHVFPVTFNTAGSPTLTVTDTVTPTITGTSPAVAVAETYLSASFAAGTVVQGASVNLTVQARDGAGTLVTGYRGMVQLASTYNGVQWNNWGSGVTTLAQYAFTATDGGSHTFTPKFTYAGDQTVTVTDTALAARTVTTSPLTVTNSPAGSYSHGATPSGVELPDGSIVMAFLGIRGRLSVRRNVGTVAEPAWRPGVLVREANAGGVGADSPSLVRFGTTLALFHTYTDGTYLQAWLTTSTDDGATWSTPVKLTNEAGHIQRLQAVVSGGTVYLFWSRQDTNGRLFYATSTDLVTWTAKATVGQAIGPAVLNTTSNFGLTRLASGTWLLGWEGTSAVNEGIFGVDHSFSYPTVHVATSPDLVTWSSAVEMNLPYSQSGSRSVALAQEPGTNLIYAVTEQWVSPGDVYIARRTSTDGANWSAAVLAGYDPSLPANGSQGYTASMPALVPGSMVVIQSVQLINSPVGSYGTSCWSNPDGGQGVQVVDIAGTPHPGGPVPLGDPKAADCPTCAAHQVGYPVNALTGHESAGATDLVAAAQGRPLTATRVYRSSDGYDGLDGPFGYGWSWSYGTHAITHADGSVTIVEGNGWRSRFWKNGATWTAGPSVNATLAPAAGGGYTLTRHDQSVWTFDGTGWLTAVADANGNTQTLTYVNGRLSTISAAGGRTLTVTTDANGHITAIAGPGGLSASYTYDANGNLATATDAAGATTTYTYDGLHQLLTVVDGNTHTVETNTYGTLGRVMSQKDAANQVTSFRYGEQGTSGSYGPTAVTDPRGNTVQYANDGAWRLTVKETFQGCCTSVGKVRWSYTANGDVASVTDGRTQDTLHVTSFTYDSRGNALTMVQDAGNLGLNLQSTFTYDSLNDLLTATDPLGHTTTYTYDSHGNRLTATDALNHTTSYAYDPQGQLTSVTDATSRTTSFGYSPQGDLTSITVPGGAQWTLGYDGAGRLTSITDPNSHTTTLTVDGLGRVTSVTNALNQTTTVTYDAAGNRTAVTDANTHRTSYGYDALNRLTSVTDALNGVTSYGYDGGGNLTSVTNALGKVWSYTYDAANRLATAKDPLGNTTTSTYDGYGNVTQLQKPDGTTNRFVYDRLNRLTGVDLANNGSLDLQYAYDTASRRTSMIDGTGTTTYAYDNANRLTSVTAPTTGTVSYGYDNANRRTSLTYPSSHQVSYGYTNRGELQTVTDWTSGSTTYTYDPAGRLTGIALPNGVSTTLGYDLADRLTAITHATGGTNLEAIQYVLDVAGNRTSMTDSSGTTTCGYDAVGNRTSLTVNGATTTSAFDAANRLTASGSTTYTYDANGNQTSKTAGRGTTTYTYDALDRLTAISGPTTANYASNGDGLRVSKTVGGTTTNYVWDPTGLPVVLTDGTEYVWGEDVCSRRRAGSAAIARRMPISRGYPPNGPAHPGRPAGRVGRGA